MTSWHPSEDVLFTDSEDEEDEVLKTYYNGREALLFIVDATMFDRGERFEEALKIIRSAFISALLVNNKDLLGVVFANTVHSPEPLEQTSVQHIVVPENCAVFLPMRQLSKAIVEHYLHFVATVKSNFKDVYGCGRGKFSSMIRLGCSLFDYCGYNLNNSTIVYLTDCELPHEPNTPDYQHALQKAKDLCDKEIEFQVIPMVDDFNYESFYREFLTLVRDIEPDSFICPDAQQLREMLADRKLKQDFVKRTLGHFQLQLGPDLEISVQYFNYFKKRLLPRKVKLLRKDNAIVKQKRVIVARKEEADHDVEDDEDGDGVGEVEERIVNRSDGWYEIKVGGTPAIRITNDRINRVRNLHAPGMMLLGFKPRSAIDGVQHRPCHFMYPDDRSICGSKRLFCALWQRCLEREKIAVCLFMAKKKATPRYVALVPVAARSADDEDDHRSILSGDGFKIIYLPFEKQIRDVDLSEWNTIENDASDEGVDVFRKIVRKLRIKYQPSLINNPTLEMLQSNLLALALDIKTNNDGLTEMPSPSLQDQRIEKFLPALKDIFGTDSEGRKRLAANASTAATAPKMPKVTAENIQSYNFVEDLIAKQQLSACTIVQLRFILLEHFGVQAAAAWKKQDLVDKISDLKV